MMNNYNTLKAIVYKSYVIFMDLKYSFSKCNVYPPKLRVIVYNKIKIMHNPFSQLIVFYCYMNFSKETISDEGFILCGNGNDFK
jgi:hypothetical protein